MYLNLGRCTGKTAFANKFKADNPGTTILINQANRIPEYKYISQLFPDITNVIIDEPTSILDWKSIYAILDFFKISDVSIIVLGEL